MSLVIRKKVSLGFLGDDYKDAFITFRAVPIKDFDAMQDDIDAIGDDNKKSLAFILDKLKHYFLNGQAPNEGGKLENITIEDLGELDQLSVLKCFESLTGQNVNEEGDFLEKPSSKPSETVAPSQ